MWPLSFDCQFNLLSSISGFFGFDVTREKVINTKDSSGAAHSHSNCQKMFKLTVVALLCAQAFARPSEDIGIESHIVGGTPAKEGEYPFIVSLRQLTGFTFCGGALISNKYVVTAAHCVADKKPLRIAAGSIYLNQQKTFDVDKIIVHPSYETVKNTNDIALLRLKTPIQFNTNIQPIEFPTNDNLDDKTVTGLGWGRTSENGPASTVLLTLKRPVLNNKDCSSRLSFPIIDSQICLGSDKGFGMCFGDSGSPLLYKGTDNKNYIAGIVSWGIPCAKGYPDVFTRVSSFASWIKQNAV